MYIDTHIWSKDNFSSNPFLFLTSDKLQHVHTKWEGGRAHYWKYWGITCGDRRWEWHFAAIFYIPFMTFKTDYSFYFILWHLLTLILHFEVGRLKKKLFGVTILRKGYFIKSCKNDLNLNFENFLIVWELFSNLKVESIFPVKVFWVVEFQGASYWWFWEQHKSFSALHLVYLSCLDQSLVLFFPLLGQFLL